MHFIKTFEMFYTQTHQEVRISINNVGRIYMVDYRYI